ncbi:MAG: HDOD domain-containing protein [Desulfobulbaceae bacterium]|nr:HDOD domain-containing protein [Desulfobulbaceae bacterium]HIJ89989.1 HDOD domain-containing protein [Deltaproteobacteria bacterium]
MNRQEKQAAVREAINKVPLISSAAARLLELSGESEHGIVDIVNIVKYDAVLTSQILKVVNSAAFARRTEVYSIDHAVSLLGEDMVVGIAMSEAAALLFDKKLEGYAAEAGSLWRHDLKTAIAAKIIAGYARTKVNGDLAFTCGLLHDLGKGVLSDFLRNTPEKIRRAMEEKKVPDYAAAERAILGIDHAEAGYELSLNWNLPAPLPQAIRFHHQPALIDEALKPLLYTIHLADIVAMMSGVGTGSDDLQYTLDTAYEMYIPLSGNELAMVMLGVEQEFSKAAAVFLGKEEEASE